METYNMAYSLETSSVKTLAPGAEVSGFCDVVARQKIGEVSAEVPKLSAGEGIGLTTVDGKTVITNNISAGENISFVYDQETNTYRIDGEGSSSALDYKSELGIVFRNDYEGDTVNPAKNARLILSGMYGPSYSTAAGLIVHVQYDKNGTDSRFNAGCLAPTTDIWQPIDTQVLTNYYGRNHWANISNVLSGAGSAQINYLSGAINYVSGNIIDAYAKTETSSKTELANAFEDAGHSYTGVAPIQVNNTTDQISITGESLSAGPGIDLFSSGGYVVISAVPSNTCCVRFTDTLTSVNLSSYLNYDKVTIVHSNDGANDCNLYWDGKTKVFPSGLYCEMVKGTNEQNVVKWSFANSGWINDNWWDLD